MRNITPYNLLVKRILILTTGQKNSILTTGQKNFPGVSKIEYETENVQAKTLKLEDKGNWGPCLIHPCPIAINRVYMHIDI